MNYKVQNLTKQQITTSLLPAEFYDSFNLCQEKKSLIDPQTTLHLDYIAKKLLTHFADEKKKQYLFLLADKKEEQENKESQFLQNTSKELLIKLYIETVKSFISDSKLYFPNMIKKGVLYVRSQHLKIWHERVLELNYNDKILSISKIGQKKQGDKDLDLNTYSLKWVGKVKGRFCFRLDSLSTKNKYKNFRIASEFLEIAVEWHENIKAALLPQLTVTNYQELKAKYQDIYSGKEKEDNVGFSEELDSAQKKKGNWTSIFSKKPTKQDEKIKSFDGAQPQIRSVKSVENRLTTSDIPENKPEKDSPNKKLCQSTFPTFETSTNRAEMTNEMNKTAIKKNPSANELITTETKESKEKVSPTKKEEKINQKQESEPNFGLMVLKKEVSEEEEGKENQEEYQNFESPQQHIEKHDSAFSILNRKSSCPSLVQDILCNIDKEDLISELDYSMLQSFDNFRILQHNIETTKYKIFFKIRSIPLQDVIRSFLDPLKYKLLNPEIVDLKILSIIQYNKSSIIYEKRKAFGRLYLPREYVYMRYTYESKDSLIIVDRTIDYNDIPHSYFSPTIRGTIESNIIYIYKVHESDGVNICFNVQSSNNGVVSTSQDHDMNFTYLKEFKNLEERISRSSHQEEIEEEKREVSFSQDFPVLDEKTIRKKTKVLTPMDQDNKDKILAGLLIKEETDLVISKKRSISADIAQKKKQSVEEIKVDANTQNIENEIVQRNREVSFACQKSAEILLDLVESNNHVLKCITNKHNMNYREVRMPHFQESNEVEGHYVLRRTDWISNKTGGFIFHNHKVLEIQKKILGYLLKRMGTNLIQGKSIMTISLPIELFETKSHLEKLANNFTFAPHFLNKANEAKEALEQMKQTVTFFITALLMATAQLKPFNPILGETFQARINGMPIYFEQVSHHPPISSFLLYGSDFKMIGNYEAHASLHANSCNVNILGSPRIIYKNGSVIYTSIPCANIGGTSFGQRTFNYEGKMFAYEPNLMLVCELTFNPDKKGLVGGLFSKQVNPTDYFSGGIYQVTSQCIANIQKCPVLNKFGGINMKEDVLKELSKVNGIWHKYVEFDGVKYWEFGKMEAYELEYDRSPLPSDSIYREDLIAWKSEDVTKAQVVKEKMENIQRADRKLREKSHKDVKGKKHDKHDH